MIWIGLLRILLGGITLAAAWGCICSPALAAGQVFLVALWVAWPLVRPRRVWGQRFALTGDLLLVLALNALTVLYQSGVPLYFPLWVGTAFTGASRQGWPGALGAIGGALGSIGALWWGRPVLPGALWGVTMALVVGGSVLGSYLGWAWARWREQGRRPAPRWSWWWRRQPQGGRG